MPDTPVLWRSQFQASSGSTAPFGFEPVVVALTNDNFVVFWQNDGTGANGVDIRGQIFDPLGNPIGGSFRANQTFFADDERNFDVAALPNGGFVVVYEDFEDATGRIDIRATEWTTTIDGGVDSCTDPRSVILSPAMPSETEEAHGEQATEARGDCQQVAAG